MSITYKIDASKALKGMARLVIANKDMTLLMKTIGEGLVTSTRHRFATSTAPDGSRWLPSRRVLESKKGGRTLVLSSRLMRSITQQSDSTTVRIGTNVVYAAIHQFGGIIRPKTKKALSFGKGKNKVTVSKVTIPARPYLGLNDADRKSIRAEVVSFLARAVAS